MHERFYARTCQCTNVSMHERFYARTFLCTNVSMHERFNSRTFICTNVSIHERFNARTFQCTNVSMHERFNARTFLCTNVSMQFSNQQSVYCYYIYISCCGFGLNMHVDFVLRICKLFYSAYTTRTYTEGIVHNVISWIWSIRSYYTGTCIYLWFNMCSFG